jgi:hypothetical protein
MQDSTWGMTANGTCMANGTIVDREAFASLGCWPLSQALWVFDPRVFDPKDRDGAFLFHM